MIDPVQLKLWGFELFCAGPPEIQMTCLGQNESSGGRSRIAGQAYWSQAFRRNESIQQVLVPIDPLPQARLQFAAIWQHSRF